MSGLFDQARARLVGAIEDRGGTESLSEMARDAASALAPVPGQDQKDRGHAISAVKHIPSKARESAEAHATKRVHGTIERLTSILPTLSAAGFQLQSCDIEAGFSPTIIPRFSIVRRVSADEKEQLLEANRGNRFARLLLEGLLQAAEMTDWMRIPGLQFAGVAVHLGTVPKVRMLFRSAGGQ